MNTSQESNVTPEGDDPRESGGPLTTPSTEQPEPPTPGGADEEAIQLDPPIPDSDADTA